VDALYLTPALQGIAALYQAETTSKINSFLLFLVIFVPIYMVVFAFVMMLYFVPAVRSVNRDIQTKRGMLLYLPLAVVQRIRSIRQLVNSIVSNADAAAGSSTAVSTSKVSRGL